MLRFIDDLLGGRKALATAGKDCSNFVSTLPGFDKVAFGSIGSLLSTLTGAIILVSGIAAFLFLLLGGVQYLTSGGDKAATQGARDRITYAIMGLAIVASAVAINQVVGAVFGVNIFGTIIFPKADSIVGNLGVCS